MSAYPNGWFHQVGFSGEKVLCYHCEKCAILYRKVPENASVLCCGQQKVFEKSFFSRLPVFDLCKRNGAVDLDQPGGARVGNSIIGTV